MPLPPRPDRRRPVAGVVAPPAAPVPRDVEVDVEGESERESGPGAAAAPLPGAPPGRSPPAEGEPAGAPETLPAGHARPVLTLDPVAAELISAAINEAIARARASFAPPVAPSSAPATPPPPSSASAPPRSSIRAGAEKGTKWGTIAVGVLALVGQIIVWCAQPEHAGPLVQAFELVGWLLRLAGGGSPAPPAP